MESELILLVKHHVDKILFSYLNTYGADYGDEELRDETVQYVVDIINKKHVNDSRFNNKKDLFIKSIAVGYLFKKYLDYKN